MCNKRKALHTDRLCRDAGNYQYTEKEEDEMIEHRHGKYQKNTRKTGINPGLNQQENTIGLVEKVE